MTDKFEKVKPKESSPLNSKVREASEVETREAGLHNEENKKIHEQTQSMHKIEHSATDLMIPPANKESMGLEDREKGIVYTGAGLVPMVPEDSTHSYAEKLMAIKPVKTEAELEERKGAATLSWMKEKGMIAPCTVEKKMNYTSAESLDGSNSLPAMNKDESVYYKVHKRPGRVLIEGGIQERHQIEESPPSPQNFMEALSPAMRTDVIAAFQKGGQVGEQAIHETTDDILRKTLQGYIDTIKAPIDVAIAAGKGLWGILEFERDLITNPLRAQETAATTGDCIGKVLVAGIKLWSAGSEYASDVQEKGEYVRPFQELGNAINKWYDSLTPGDQMHAMAIVSAGFGLGAAAGQLRELAKPGAFVQFLEEAAQSVPKNPEAQTKATESVKKLIEAFSKSKKPAPALVTGVIDSGETGLSNQIDRASKAMKDKFDELYNKMTRRKGESESGKQKWDSAQEAHEADIPAPQSLDNIKARDWYNARVAEIDNFEREMRQAGKSSEEIFDTTYKLRTQAKIQTRDLMEDRERVKELPLIPTKEEILAKYGGDYEKAIASSKRTNPGVNQMIDDLRKRKDSDA